jgi:hypothetical protein
MSTVVRVPLSTLLVLAATIPLNAEKLRVRIVQRHVSDSYYSYVVPASFSAHERSTASCAGYYRQVNCEGSATTTGTVTPPRRVGYSVRGATFSLLVPDGRLVVVNCESKYRPRGDYINLRSCRIPLVDEITVDFKGNKAKLRWPVSLDGKKMQSETYNVLAILGPQR